MRRILTVLFLFVAYSFSFAQTKSDVTFNVNMGVAAAKGKFNVATDSVYIAGTVQNPTWVANTTVLRRTSSTTDTVYSIKLSLNVDSTYEFKFISPAGSWESVNNRSYKVKANAADNILNFYFNDDKTYPAGAPKAIKVTFRCNMELEIAKGFFDISKDQVNVRGIGGKWGSDPLIMKKALTSNIYSIDTTITMTASDSLEYKYAYTHAGATTWESGSNYKFGLSAAEFAAGAVTAANRYFDNGDKNASANPFDVYFQVNVKNAVPAGGASFPQGVKSVVVCGSQNPLIWPEAGWPDSALAKLVKCNDEGLEGDLVKGDGIWTGHVKFPKYSGLKFEYKYGINYGMAGANGGVNDNENSIGENHKITVDINATLIRTNDVFGKMGETTITGVNDDKNVVVKAYSLDQNFPNPFNPSTVIRFAIPASGMVTLKVYDVLGKEVATLINSELKAGQYEQQFNASNLTSGIYFYTIQSGSFSQSKKMMLIK